MFTLWLLSGPMMKVDRRATDCIGCFRLSASRTLPLIFVPFFPMIPGIHCDDQTVCVRCSMKSVLIFDYLIIWLFEYLNIWVWGHYEKGVKNERVCQQAKGTWFFMFLLLCVVVELWHRCRKALEFIWPNEFHSQFVLCSLSFVRIGSDLLYSNEKTRDFEYNLINFFFDMCSVGVLCHWMQLITRVDKRLLSSGVSKLQLLGL